MLLGSWIHLGLKLGKQLLNSSAIGDNQSSFHPKLVEIGFFHLNEIPGLG